MPDVISSCLILVEAVPASILPFQGSLLRFRLTRWEGASSRSDALKRSANPIALLSHLKEAKPVCDQTKSMTALQNYISGDFNIFGRGERDVIAGRNAKSREKSRFSSYRLGRITDPLIRLAAAKQLCQLHTSRHINLYKPYTRESVEKAPLFIG